MTISYLTQRRHEDWDNFVSTQAQGTFFHLSGWKAVLEEAFGFEAHYLYSEQNGRIKAVLPLALVRRPFFGSALISTPLCVYGGGLGQCEELEEYALQKARAHGVEYLELRKKGSCNHDTVDSLFYTFEKPISQNHDENLKSIPRKQRAEVRRAIKYDLTERCDQDLNGFYKIYAQSVKKLGTPVFARRYLTELVKIFGDKVRITTISKDGNPLSSVLSFSHHKTILPYYGGGISEARQYSAYPYMYWQVMAMAADQGFDYFDFGRSMKGGGAFAFKKNFGFDPVPLSYQYHLIKASHAPDMRADSPRNKVITSIWRQLPLPVANMVGPFLYPVIA